MTKKRNNIAIDYTARDFDSIRERLIDHAKKYYPETFQDFSEGSFGSILVDMVSYIGDQLSLYLDHSVNETFLTTANQYDNVVKLGHQMGYKFDPTPAATGVVTLYIVLPVDSTGQIPDIRYAPILKAGSTFVSSNGAQFTLTNDVDFGNREQTRYLVVQEDEDTGQPVMFGAESFGLVVSGRTRIERFQIGAHQPFLKIELQEENVSEVISVTDSEGRDYYEVEYLTQDTVYREISNGNSRTKDAVPMVIRPVAVPRRFILERTGESAGIRFGYGSETEERAGATLSPVNVVLKQHARRYISDFSFDPYNMLKSDKLGIVPQNTLVTVKYRTNGRNVVNVPANSITRIGNTDFRFDLSDADLDPDLISSVTSSLEVVNEEPYSGSSAYPSIDELKYRISSSYTAQNRAVTLSDYKAVIYNMPKRFGSFSKCYVERDEDSFKNNINVYLLCEDHLGKLTQANETAKMNLKTWLKKYKTVMDTVDLLDGRVVNLGIDFLVKISPGREEALVLNDCYAAIATELGQYSMQMGETFYRSHIVKALSKVNFVMSVLDVSIRQRFGKGYSDVFYNIEAKTLSDGTGIVAEKDICFEVKYPNIDIRGAIER